MKQIILTLLFAAGAFQASAQSLDYLTFRQADGTETSLGIDNLVITFTNGRLTADNGEQQFSTALTDMDRMFFAATPTAIDQAVTAPAAGRVRIVGGRLLIDGTPATDAAVYSLDGRRQSPTRLTRGVYVVRIQGETLKLMAE